MEPCTSLNGSLPLNFCSALHLNSIGVQHEHPPRASASTDAQAFAEVPVLICPEIFGQLSLQPIPDARARLFSARSRAANIESRPKQRVFEPSGSAVDEIDVCGHLASAGV